MDTLQRLFIVSVLATCTAACGGGGGGSGDAPAAPAAQPPTISMSASPTSVAAGGTSQLSWSTTAATSCTASNGWSGSRSTSGSFQTAALNASTTFSLSCNGAGGGALASVTVTVVGSNSPSVQLSASPAGVAPGGSTTLTWSSANVTTCTASGGWSGSRPTSGNESVGPIQTDTTYQLSCSGPGGNAVAMTTVSARIARLSWTAPTQNTDGTPITNLTGYTVHWGNSSRSYSQNAPVAGATNTQYQVTLSPGTWYFAVTATAAGVSSAYSGEVSKTVN